MTAKHIENNFNEQEIIMSEKIVQIDDLEGSDYDLYYENTLKYD